MGKCRILFVLSLLFLFASLVAQAPTGTLTGTVTDESGAVIPDTDISLMNEATGDTRRTLANDQGFFSLTAIPSATYTLQIEMPGFAIWKRTGIVLRVADRINVPDIVLRVASTAQEITVSAAPAGMVPTDSGEKAAIITSKQIQDLSIFKNWQIGSTEDRKLQFRVSFYNILNHPLPFFSGQETTLNFTGGVITEQTIEQDNVGRTALKRGRRIMQFALKYMF